MQLGNIHIFEPCGQSENVYVFYGLNQLSLTQPEDEILNLISMNIEVGGVYEKKLIVIYMKN